MTTRIEQLVRDWYAPELPYGFAERTAARIMASEQPERIWEMLLGLTPRAGLAIGALATLLAVLGYAGTGPGLVDAFEDLASIEQVEYFLPTP